MLVDHNGAFSHSFLSLWLRHIFSGPRGRSALREQVRTEYAAQLSKVRDATGLAALHVDSHVHFHMIPFVFDTLLSLRSEHAIRSIRIPREPFFLCVRSLRDLRNYVGANMIKHVLLNLLALRNRKCIREAGDARFLGVLFSGRMTLSAIAAGLRRVPRESTVEVLLHPGRADVEEVQRWNDRPALLKFYRSVDRAEEGNLLKDPALRERLEARV